MHDGRAGRGAEHSDTQLTHAVAAAPAQRPFGALQHGPGRVPRTGPVGVYVRTKRKLDVSSDGGPVGIYFREKKMYLVLVCTSGRRKCICLQMGDLLVCTSGRRNRICMHSRRRTCIFIQMGLFAVCQ